ncbi:hypothetical protein RJT34_31447 [Clitoria ternatea]|uniref:Uncharacterized protein n=1 Tax=Clitoria ternatea TaxID=43366 RepID=A0AAN9EYK1_CLITE
MPRHATSSHYEAIISYNVDPSLATWDHPTGCHPTFPTVTDDTTRSPKATTPPHTSSPRTLRVPLPNVATSTSSHLHVSPRASPPPRVAGPTPPWVREPMEIKSSLFVLATISNPRAVIILHALPSYNTCGV